MCQMKTIHEVIWEEFKVASKLCWIESRIEPNQIKATEKKGLW